MNWGNKILVTLIVFVAGMAFMVTLAFKQDVVMMDKDYYGQELSYQKKIDASNNLSKTEQGELLTILNEGLKISFPNRSVSLNQKVTCELICYNQPKNDLQLSQTINSENELIIRHLVKANYRFRLSWTNLEVDYFFERDIAI